LAIDSELFPLLVVVVVLVLRTSAQARQEGHLSSPESTPTAGAEHEAKIPKSLGCWDGGLGRRDINSGLAQLPGNGSIFPGASRRRGEKKRRRLSTEEIGG